MDSIESNVFNCLEAFNSLCDTIKSLAKGHDDEAYLGCDAAELPLEKVEDEQSRFKIWSANIGAHKKGRSSLDYRLRDASNIRNQVITLLHDLKDLLTDGKNILSGDETPWDQEASSKAQFEVDLDDDSDDDSLDFEEEETSELSQILDNIIEDNNCLFRLSVSLRNPAPHDQFKKSSLTDTSYYERNDIDHVRGKFPSASNHITERLGKAISRRRQYFKYRDMHHRKLGSGFDEDDPDGLQSTVASSIPDHMKEVDKNNSDLLDETDGSDTGRTQTSFATTFATKSERPQVPPLPKGAEDGPFECPFCFMMILAPSRRLWKKHVFSDLRPYVCLSQDCPAPDQDFERRHQWANHMQKYHWKTWTCSFGCNSVFNTFEDIRLHITKRHGAPSNSALSIIALCERQKSLNDKAECPFCEEVLPSFKHYQRHIGRHQEDLSLFALPRDRTNEEDEEDEEGSSEGDEMDHETDGEVDFDVEAKALAEAELKAHVEAENATRERIEAERKAEEERVRTHTEAMREAEERARLRFEAELKAAEEMRKGEAEARIKAESDAKARFEAEMKAADEARKRDGETEALAEVEAEAKFEAEMRAAEERGKREGEARARAEIEARRKFEAELKAAEAVENPDARDKAVAEARAKAKFEAEMRVAAQDPTDQEAEARAMAKFEAQLKAAEEKSQKEAGAASKLETYDIEELRRAKSELDEIQKRDLDEDVSRLRDKTNAKEEDGREKMAQEALERYMQEKWEHVGTENDAQEISGASTQEERDRIKKQQKIREEREREAKEAVEKYKQEERDRIAKEKEKKEEMDQEYERRFEKELQKAGSDDDSVKAILNDMVTKQKEEEAKAAERYRQEERDRVAKNKDREAQEIAGASTQEERDRIKKQQKIREEREREAKEAVEKYKQEERDRIAKEKEKKEGMDQEYKRRLEEDLRRSGVDEDAIKAILNKEKVKGKEPAQAPHEDQSTPQITINSDTDPETRPTYTRMARRHLSIETLRDFNIEYVLDEDPGYLLVKRWVPEWEQDQLWKHTRKIREKRKSLVAEEEGQQSPVPEFEWVRKKHDRKRSKSKSPSLLMYLAGASPGTPSPEEE